MAEVTLYGYPLHAFILYDGNEVDLSSAITLDPTEHAVHLDAEKVLDLIHRHELQAPVASARTVMKVCTGCQKRLSDDYPYATVLCGITRHTERVAANQDWTHQ
jgi:hypothetical protein